MSKLEFPPGDYVSPNLARVRPDDAFPNMVIGDTSISTWPHLRAQINHNWYVDRRAPSVGFVSRDEASILYNTALELDGRACLEIGTWRGWSTVHMALGAHSLDSIDPILSDPAIHNELVEALRRAGVEDRVSLHASRSPEGVEAIAARTGKRWSFAFIDGDHEGEGPILDAKVVERFVADDAVIILHDVAAPEPAAALAYLRDQGWTTAIYQTMQILGVATRGRCRPVRHIPDPSQKWSLPKHLTSFAVVGESHRTALRRIFVAMGRPAVDNPESPAPVDTEELERAATGDALRAAEQMANELRIAREGFRPDLERHFDDLHTRYLRLARTLSDHAFTQARLAADLANAHSARDKALTESHRLELEQTRLEGLLSSSVRALAAKSEQASRSGQAAKSEQEEIRKLEAAELIQLRDKAKGLSRKLREAQASDQWFRSRDQMMQAVDPFARKDLPSPCTPGVGAPFRLGRNAETRQILAAYFPLKERGSHYRRACWPGSRARVRCSACSAVACWPEQRRPKASWRRHCARVSAPAMRFPMSPHRPDSERAVAQVQRSLDNVTAQLTAEQRRAGEIEGKLAAVERAMVAEERALYDAQIELTKLRRGASVDAAAPAPEALPELPR